MRVPPQGCWAWGGGRGGLWPASALGRGAQCSQLISSLSGHARSELISFAERDNESVFGPMNLGRSLSDGLPPTLIPPPPQPQLPRSSAYPSRSPSFSLTPVLSAAEHTGCPLPEGRENWGEMRLEEGSAKEDHRHPQPPRPGKPPPIRPAPHQFPFPPSQLIPHSLTCQWAGH